MDKGIFTSNDMLDGVRFSQLLRRVFVQVPNIGNVVGDFEILDLACGRCAEAEALSSFFRNKLSVENVSPRSVHLFGMDIREKEIQRASERMREYQNLDKRAGGDLRDSATFEFLLGDATQVSRHRELPKSFDLVFLRHQNFWDGDAKWKRIFSQGIEKLSDDGFFMITSYFDREHELAIRAIQELGGKLVANLRNEKSRQLSTPGKSVDRHIALFRR